MTGYIYFIECVIARTITNMVDTAENAAQNHRSDDAAKFEEIRKEMQTKFGDIRTDAEQKIVALRNDSQEFEEIRNRDLGNFGDLRTSQGRKFAYLRREGEREVNAAGGLFCCAPNSAAGFVDINALRHFLDESDYLLVHQMPIQTGCDFLRGSEKSLCLVE